MTSSARAAQRGAPDSGGDPAGRRSAASDGSLASSLYVALRDRLFARVLEGAYPDGSFLPTEAALGREFNLSRVTVRKALQALKNDGVIASVQGQGTRVTYKNSGHAGRLQLITLVADVENEFFTAFMRRFEAVAESRGAVVVLKTGGAGATFTSDALFQKLIHAGIRDLVLWPLSPDLDPDRFARLRAVGANLVVFDQQVESPPWADVVCLDNRAALANLLDALRRQGCRRPALLSYTDLRTPTALAREAAFADLTRPQPGQRSRPSERTPTPHGAPLPRIERVPAGADQGELDAAVGALIDRCHRVGRVDPQNEPDGWIGLNGGAGLALARAEAAHVAATGQRRPRPVACIDRLPAMAGLKVVAIEQPMDRLADLVFQCLQRQHARAGRWKARLYTAPGRRVLT